MKLRKLAAVFMAAALAVTSLAACGNDENEGSESKKQAGSFGKTFSEGMDLDNVTYEGKFTMEVSASMIDGMDESVEAILGSSDKLSLSVTVGGQTAGTDSHTTIGFNINDKLKADLLDMYMVNKTAYLGVATIADGVSGLLKEITGEDISDMLDMYLPDGDYMKLTEDDLADILDVDTSSLAPGTVGGYVNGLTSGDTDKYAELFEYFMDLIDKGIKKGAKDAYSQDGDTYKITISDKNINAIVGGVADVMTSKSSEVAKKLSAVLGDDTVDADSISSVASLMKNYDVAEEMGAPFELVLSTSYKDNTWTFGISLSGEEDGESIYFGIDYKAVKDDKLEIKAPSDVMSDEDAQEIISLIKDAVKNGDDASGILSFDVDTDDDSDYDWDIDDTDDDSDYDWDINDTDDDSDYDWDIDDTDDDPDYDWDINDTDDDSDYDWDIDDTDDDDSQDNNTQGVNQKRYSSVSEFVKSSEVQNLLEQVSSTLESTGLSMEVEGRGNKLVYMYTYTDMSFTDEQIKSVYSELDKQMPSMESQMLAVIDGMEDYVDVQNPVVVVEYLTKDGTLIYSHEFTK